MPSWLSSLYVYGRYHWLLIGSPLWFSVSLARADDTGAARRRIDAKVDDDAGVVRAGERHVPAEVAQVDDLSVQLDFVSGVARRADVLQAAGVTGAPAEPAIGTLISASFVFLL